MYKINEFNIKIQGKLIQVVNAGTEFYSLLIDSEDYKFHLITPKRNLTLSYRFPGPMKNFLLIAWIVEYIYNSYKESLSPDAVVFIEDLYQFTNTVQDKPLNDFIGEIK